MPTFQELLGSRLAALGKKSPNSGSRIPDVPPEPAFSVGGYGLVGGLPDRSSLQELEQEAAYREQEARIAQQREDSIRRRQQYRKAVDQTSRMNLRNETGFVKPPASDEQILNDATADTDRKLKDDKRRRMIQSSPFARMAVVRARAQDLIANGMDPSTAMQQAEEEKTKTDAIEQSSYELELAENESKGQGLREGSEIGQRVFLDVASAGARLVGARETADNWLATSEGVGRANEELRTKQDKYKSRILGVARDDISRAISSAGQSIGKTAMAAPATLAGGPVAGLAAMNFIYGTDAWNKGLKAAEDAGLNGNDRHEFAVKETASELLLMNVMQRIPGFGGAESLALKPIVRQSLAKTSVSALTNLTGEVIEEVGTDILHRMNAVSAGVDPSAMDPEKLSAGLKETIGVALLTTAMMGSPQVASSVRNYIADPSRANFKGLAAIEEAKSFTADVNANGNRRQREELAQKLAQITADYEQAAQAKFEQERDSFAPGEEQRVDFGPVEQFKDKVDFGPVEQFTGANPATDLADMGGEIGRSIGENLRKMLLEKVETGDVTENGRPSTILQVAKAIKDAGVAVDASMLERIQAGIDSARKTGDFQSAMRSFVTDITRPTNELVDSLPTDGIGVQGDAPAPDVSQPALTPEVNDQPVSGGTEQKPEREPWYPGQVPVYQPTAEAVPLGTGDGISAFYEPSSGATVIVDDETQMPITGLSMRMIPSVEQAAEWVKSQGIAIPEQSTQDDEAAQLPKEVIRAAKRDKIRLDNIVVRNGRHATFLGERSPGQFEYHDVLTREKFMVQGEPLPGGLPNESDVPLSVLRDQEAKQPLKSLEYLEKRKEGIRNQFKSNHPDAVEIRDGQIADVDAMISLFQKLANESIENNESVKETIARNKLEKGGFATVVQKVKDEILEQAGSSQPAPVVNQESPASDPQTDLSVTGEPQTDLSQESAGPKPLPPLSSLKDNYRKPLATYSDRIFHQTDLVDALAFIPGSNLQTEMREVFVANSPDLALGQKGKTGVLLEFEPGDIQGQINQNKPAWEPAFEAGYAEFIASHTDQRQWQSNLKSMTVSKDAAATGSTKASMERILKGWNSETLPDGSVKYTPPKSRPDWFDSQTDADMTATPSKVPVMGMAPLAESQRPDSTPVDSAQSDGIRQGQIGGKLAQTDIATQAAKIILEDGGNLWNVLGDSFGITDPKQKLSLAKLAGPIIAQGRVEQAAEKEASKEAAMSPALRAARERSLQKNKTLSAAEFKQKLQSSFGEEEGAAQYQLVEARARAAGETVDEYVGRRVADVRSSDPAEIGDNALLQDEQAVLGPLWHLKSRDVVKEKMGKRATGVQTLRMLESAGVKPEEMEWSGLTDLLSEKAMVTKEEVLRTIDNGITVEETMLGEPTSLSKDDIRERQVEEAREILGRNNALTDEVEAAADRWLEDGGDIEAYDLLDDALRGVGEADMEMVRQVVETHLSDNVKQPTKYTNYQLSGGKEYRELLLRLPEENATENHPYESSHFDQPNILAHIRFNERADAKDGSRTMFLEEVQSDWHQEGRRHGYRNENEGILKDLVTERDALDVPVKEAFERMRAAAKRDAPESEFGPLQEEHKELLRKRNEYQRRIEELTSREVGVPNAPFKKSWPMLAMKRAIQYAVENGFDRVSWTTGETQAARYDLSKQVQRIEWDSTYAGKKFVTIKPVDDGSVFQFDVKDGKVFNPNGPATSLGLGGKHIEDVVGKEIGAKILGDDFGNLAGDNLSLGGDGMKSFYDQMLPKEVGKFIKKFGAKVEQSQIATNKKPEQRYEGPDRTIEDVETVLALTEEFGNVRKTPFVELDFQVVNTVANTREVKRVRDTMNNGASFTDAMTGSSPVVAELFGGTMNTIFPGAMDNVHSFKITPEMRESALKNGQPLFQRPKDGGQAKGAIEFQVDGKAIIHAFESKDASTGLHELFHLFRRDLTGKDKVIAEKWAGVKDGNWTNEAEEKFARGGEKYLRTGKAPTAALNDLFAKFKNWLSDVYKILKGSPIDVKISKEMQGVFDRLFASPDDRIDVAQVQESSTDVSPTVTQEELGQLLIDNESQIRKVVSSNIKDQATVDDLVQDVNAKVLEKGWDPSQGEFKKWVSRVARNTRIDHGRKQSASNQVQGDQEAIAQVPDVSSQQLEPDEAAPDQPQFDPDQGVTYTPRKGEPQPARIVNVKQDRNGKFKYDIEIPGGKPPKRSGILGDRLTARELTEEEKQPKVEPTFDDKTREMIEKQEPLKSFTPAQKVIYTDAKGNVTEATVIRQKGRKVEIRRSNGRTDTVGQNRLTEPEEDPFVRVARENEVTENEIRQYLPQVHEQAVAVDAEKEKVRGQAVKRLKINARRINTIEDKGGDLDSIPGFDVASRDFAAEHPEIFGNVEESDVPAAVWEMIKEGKQEIPDLLSEEMLQAAAEEALRVRKSGNAPLTAAEQAEQERQALESIDEFDLEGTDDSFDFGANVEEKPAATIEIAGIGRDGKKTVEMVTREEGQKRSVRSVLNLAKAEKITRGEQIEDFAANKWFHNDRTAQQSFDSAEEFGAAAREAFEAEQNAPIEMKGESAIRTVEPKKEVIENQKTKQPGLFLDSKNDLPGQEMLFGFANFDKEKGKKPKGGSSNASVDAGLSGVDNILSEGDTRREDAADSDEETLGFGLGGFGKGSKETVRLDQIPEAIKADDPEFESALQNARGYKPESLTNRVIRGAKEYWGAVTRAQQYIPNTGKFGRFNEFFRLLKAVPEAASDEVNRTIAEIVDELGPNHLMVFERKLIYENIVSALAAGQPLRFRAKSPEAVQAELDKINQLLKRDELAPVRRALEKRERARRSIVKRMVDAGLMDEQALENDSYFHQQVLDRLMLDSKYSGTGMPNEMKRSFQKRRKDAKNEGESWDETYDWNTNYLESEATWMTEAEIEIRKNELLTSLPDQMAEFKQKAKDLNYEAIVGGAANVNRLEQLRGEAAEIRAMGDMDSGDKARLKAISEEIWELDPTMPFRQRMAIAADQFADETGINFSAPESSGLIAEMNRVINAPDGTPGKGPAGGFLKAMSDRQKFIEETLGADINSWQSLLRERDDVASWQPRQGNLFFRAFTIPERLAEMLQLKIIEEAQLSLEDLKQVTVVGPQRTPIILPLEVVNELNNTTKGEAQGAFTELASDALGAWKIHTLLNPKKLLAYMARNVTGDIDPVIGGAPGAFKFMSQASKELSDFYGSKTKLGMSDTLRIARDLGVIDSGMSSQDIPDLQNLRMFQRFYTTNPLKTERVFENYYAWAKGINAWREGVARYAAFLHYRDALKSGTIKHYGGSKKEVIDSLVKDLGVDVAAANLSRNLLGDYGNLTVMGDLLRKRLIPFWSFQEVNMKRYPRLVLNALRSGDKKTAASAATVAVARVIVTSRIAAMTAALHTWNHLVLPAITGDDEEDDLPLYDRQNPHINFGKNADGTTKVFRGVGAMGDFLEWFGLNSFPQLYKSYQNGQIGLDDMLIEMSKDPMNKVVGGLRPELKLLEEVGAGQSRFPDFINPRAIARDEAIPSAVGFNDEYRWMRGMLLGDGTRPRSHYFQRLFFGVSDPRANAINEMHDLRQKFLALEGRDTSNVGRASRYKTIRDAAFNLDYDAFVEAKNTYLKEGGTLEGFEGFLQRLDPVDGRISDELERKFESEFLTADQREKLNVARDYAKEMEVTLWQWWVASTAGDTETNNLTDRKARLVYQAVQVTRESSDETKQQAEDAMRRLKPMEITREEARKSLNTYFLDQAQKRENAEAAKRNRKPRTLTRFDRSDAYYTRLRKLNKLFSEKSSN